MTAEDRNLTDNAIREIAHLTEFAADTRRDPAERAAALLTAHQRRDVGSCLCGWAELGMSHALHQADVLAQAGLLAATSPLQERIDKSADPTTVEADPRGWDTQCACAYDYPWSVCAVHQSREGRVTGRNGESGG